MATTESLEVLLAQATKDPSLESAFLEVFLESDIYCLGEIIGEVDESDPEAEMDLDIVHWEDPETEAVMIPFFTSLDAMAEVISEDSDYLQMRAADFLAMTEGETVVLNPELESERAFSAAEVAALLD